MMRILTGRFKGKAVPLTPGASLRPTMNKVRMALMNILADSIRDASLLDLFSGTGALGLEAMSNGVKEIVFVERNSRLCSMIRNLVASLRYDGSWQVLHQDVELALKDLAAQNRQFDLIFADPPYENGWNEKVLSWLNRYPLLRKDGWFVLETSTLKKPDNETGLLRLQRIYKYGQTRLLFYSTRPS